MWIWVHSSVLSSSLHLCLPLPDSGNGTWKKLREYPVQFSGRVQVPSPKGASLNLPKGAQGVRVEEAASGPFRSLLSGSRL